MTARVLDLTVVFIAGLAIGLAIAMLLDEVERRETDRVVSGK